MATLSCRLFLLLSLNVFAFSFCHGQAITTGCSPTYFKGSYSPLSNGNVSLLSTAIGPDGNIYLGCIAHSSYSIMKLDSSGNLIRTTSYLPDGMTKSDGPGKIIIDYDGNLFSVFSNNNIIKTDTAGNILSARQLFAGGTSLDLEELSMLANGDKVFVFFGRDINGRFCDYLVVTNPDASIIKWTKYLYAYSYIHSYILADGNKIVLGVSLVQSVVSDIGTGLIQFDGNTGAILYQKWFSEPLSFNQILRYNNGYIFTGNSQLPSIAGFYARTDTTLNLISIHNFPFYFDVDIVYHYILQPAADGALYGFSSHPGAMNLFRISADDMIEWTSGLLATRYPTTPKSITFATTGILIGTDLTTNSGISVPKPAIQLFKGSYAGYFPSCANPTTGTTTMSVLPVTPINPFTRFRDTAAFASKQITVPVTSLALSSNICSAQPTCNSIKIVGNPIVCSGSGVFAGNPNSGCSLPIVWSVTGGPGTAAIQSAGTNAVNINFNQDGIYNVRASINTGCSNFGDSLLVHVNTGSRMNLGNDTLLCAGDSLRLQPGNNFSSYTWQDGSTDSTFLVRNPGQFMVTTKDYCGNIRSSAINVSYRSPVASPFPPTVSKCPTDTLTLSIPTGFDSIYFNTVSASSRIFNNKIQFFNQTSSIFFLQERDNNHCKVDSKIAVEVYGLPALYIGNDTTICTGDSIKLDAGSAFNNFHWSNGSFDKSIFADHAGTYWVQSTSLNGCVTGDTVKLGLYQLPSVHLDPDTILCTGAPRLLSTDNEFSSYLWNDGSIKPSLEIAKLGTYWVKVTDLHGCANSDTATISILKTGPHDFLPPDTSICSYQDLHIFARGTFTNFLWNSGEQTQSLEIKKAGSYILKVMDQFGCSGKDTIAVGLKDCGEGIYFPSAFSPNGDGNNDIYRPSVYGQLTSYRINIYNRFGQLIFSTTDYRQAWDGKISGKLQDAGGYAWSATWQFSNSASESKKGILLLVK